MNHPVELYPIDKPVLTVPQRVFILGEAPGWRSVMRQENKGPLTYEVSRVLRVTGFPALLELVTRAAQAEADHEHRQGLRDVDWLMAMNELHGDAAAKAVYTRACELADIPTSGGA